MVLDINRKYWIISDKIGAFNHVGSFICLILTGIHNDYYDEDIPDAEINEDVPDAGMLGPSSRGSESPNTRFACLALLNGSRTLH